MNGLFNVGAFSDAAFWWFGAGLLIAAELASGTFYLLMLAVGLAAAALSAHLGFGPIVQVMVAAAVGGCSVGALWFVRKGRPREAPARSNRAVNLDIGNKVQVAWWDDKGATRLHYRGAEWQARFEGPGAPAPGEYIIRALDGNFLVLGQ